MDFESNASKSGYSKSLNPLSNHQKKSSDELIVIDEDDSIDSAYETGSSLSRSSQSSPTSDIQDSKIVTIDTKSRHSKIKYYANVNCDHNFIGPWQLVSFVQESCTPTAIANISEIVEISDSDDDDTQRSLSKSAIMRNSIVPSKYFNDDIISIDSDDEDAEQIEYIIVQCSDGAIKKIPQHCIANATGKEPNVELAAKTRIIAQRKTVLMPMIYSKFDDQFVPSHANDEQAFYPGIISSHKYLPENKIWQYLVFFDDGHVQYVSNKNIRVVFGDFGTKYVHSNAQRFYDYYFNGVQKAQLIEIVMKVDTMIRVFLNGEFETARVVKYDAQKSGLALLQYQKTAYAEWLYTGSPRFKIVWTSINKNKKLEQYHDANATMIEVSSDSEDEEDYDSPKKQPLPLNARDPLQKLVMLKPNLLIDNYKATRKLDRRHTCGSACVREFEGNEQIFTFDPLKRPLLAGWTRNSTGLVYYAAPCGRSITTIDATYKYLRTTKSKLTIDCFTFSMNIDCMTEMRSYSVTGRIDYLNDLIPGGNRENQRIPVVSIGANVPHFTEYVTRYRRNPKSKKVPDIFNNNNNNDNNQFRSSCDCNDDCSTKSKCACWQLTRGNLRHSVGYKYRRLEDKVFTGIYECNANCKCSSRCLNRVVKAEIEQKLELYETKDRGYGIRCQTDLPRGTFVACYFGDLLHGKTADERAMKKVGSMHGDEYFMQLDHIEMSELHKDGYESDVEFDLDDLQTPMKRPKLDDSFKRTPRTKITKDIIDYFPSNMKKKQAIEVTQRTELFGENAVEFVVDGRFRGNISRFFNHSCSPNLFSQNVFVDTHDLRFPWLAFFTSCDIKAGTELTWDYNYTIGSIEGRQMECKCGAAECRKRLL